MKVAAILTVLGLALPCPGAMPDNDAFATRIALFGTNLTVTGSNVDATQEIGEPDPNFTGGKSVWWTWTAPANGSLTLDTAGSDFDISLAVYTGDSFTNLTLVAFNDSVDSFGIVTINVSAGTAYQIDADGLDGTNSMGNITLHLALGPTQPPPANDNFASRITLTGQHLSNVTGSNVGATAEPGEPFHADTIGLKSVWWTWTAPFSGALTLNSSGTSTHGGALDTVLAVYTGDSVSELIFVAANDEDSFGYESLVTCNVSSGVTYQIAVDGYEGDEGSIRLRLDLDSTPLPNPPNDNFANRVTLAGSNIYTNGSNVGATFETNEPMHLVTFGGKSIWWKWTAPSSGGVMLTTSNSAVDTILCVYRGNALTNLVFVAGNDNASETDLTSIAYFNVTGGTTYQIAVDGFDGDSGAISLHLVLDVADPVPANDNFANAVLVTGTNATVTGSNIGATLEPGEPLHRGYYGGCSVWWKWTSPGAGYVTIDTSNSVPDTLLAVYTGSSVSNLTEIASDDNSAGGTNWASRVMFTTKSNVTYRIAVDGYDGDAGNLTVHLRFSKASYSLNLATNPPAGGSAGVTPLPDQAGKYAPGSVVLLTATPSAGYLFSNWTGSAVSTNNPLSLLLNANKSLTANFYLPAITLKTYQPQSAESIQSNGFRLLLSGPTNVSCAMERSANLTNWTAFQTNLVTSNSFEFRDWTASNAPFRFYRARRIP